MAAGLPRRSGCNQQPARSTWIERAQQAGIETGFLGPQKLILTGRATTWRLPNWCMNFNRNCWFGWFYAYPFLRVHSAFSRTHAEYTPSLLPKYRDCTLTGERWQQVTTSTEPVFIMSPRSWMVVRWYCRPG